jgi:hypothetical protein
MTGAGVTYEDFGFGPYQTNFNGWTRLGAPDFKNDVQAQYAFAYLYSRGDYLINLQPNWNSNNCCFIDTTNNSWYAFVNGTYMYPANTSNNNFNCNGVYADAKIRIYLQTGAVVRSSFTQPEIGQVALSNACSVSNNPAIFVKRY